MGLDISKMLEKVNSGMDTMPKCDNCKNHLAGGALTFNDIGNIPKTWCMKCVLEAISVFQRYKEERLRSDENGKQK